MLFFQVVLFAGYCYAHLLQRWLAPRRQATVHLAVVAAGLALLPILPGPYWKPHDVFESDVANSAAADRHGGAAVFRPVGDQPAGSSVV